MLIKETLMLILLLLLSCTAKSTHAEQVNLSISSTTKEKLSFNGVSTPSHSKLEFVHDIPEKTKLMSPVNINHEDSSTQPFIIFSKN